MKNVTKVLKIKNNKLLYVVAFMRLFYFPRHFSLKAFSDEENIQFWNCHPSIQNNPIVKQSFPTSNNLTPHKFYPFNLSTHWYLHRILRSHCGGS